MKLKQSLFILVLLTSLISCNKKDYSHYIDEDNPDKVELNQLFPLLDKYKDYSENRFTVMSEIISHILAQDNRDKLNLLITDYINENPDDPYNSYYLLSLASSYLKKDLSEFAIPYLHKAVMNYNDLVIRDESTHFKALEILLRISPDNEYKVFYYKKLIRDHVERVEKRDIFTGGIGELYYYLGKTLENIEKWEESIEAFESYLEFEDAVISQDPGALDQTIKKVGFYHSDKTWVAKDLDTLVTNVKWAIASRNPGLLDKYRSFDFFIINWKSKYSDLKSSFPMESHYLTSMNIKTNRNLDSMSTENEAYLEVWGSRNSIWYVYPTWFFYFKKVDFPMDPEIHGGWEWVGIYLGEKL